MKYKKIHISSLGNFCVGLGGDFFGYVLIHDSDRYAKANENELTNWIENGRTLGIRNAARLEFNERNLSRWQKRTSK